MVKGSIEAGSRHSAADVMEHDHRAWRGDRSFATTGLTSDWGLIRCVKSALVTTDITTGFLTLLESGLYLGAPRLDAPLATHRSRSCQAALRSASRPGPGSPSTAAGYPRGLVIKFKAATGQ